MSFYTVDDLEQRMGKLRNIVQDKSLLKSLDLPSVRTQVTKYFCLLSQYVSFRQVQDSLDVN